MNKELLKMTQLNNNGQFLFIDKRAVEAVEIIWFEDTEHWKFNIYTNIHTYTLITANYNEIKEWLKLLEIKYE